MDFHRISSFKEFTVSSITQKDKIRNQSIRKSLHKRRDFLIH